MTEKFLSRKAACAAIVATGKQLLAKKLVAGTWGNISCRTRKGYAITPSGLGYEKLAPADVVLLAEDGNVHSKNHLPSSEAALHLEIYKNLPDAGAVIHTHSIYASVLAAMHADMPALIEDMVQIIGGNVRCAEYALPGTEALAKSAVQALDGRRAALLANHGAVVYGKDLSEALLVAEILEKSAQIAVFCKACGKICELDPDDVRSMRQFYLEHYAKRQRGEE